MSDALKRRHLSDFGALIFPSLLVWIIVGACCVLPVLWLGIQLIIHRANCNPLNLDAFRFQLLLRTLLYNCAVAVVAMILAMPAALVLGRGRGLVASALWLALPVSLLLPSLTFAYGWKQCLRLLDVCWTARFPQQRPFDFDPAGYLDVGRCVWSLATWLWPVPAMVMGLALRRVDTNLQQQAQLDGVLFRITVRQLLSPALASMAIVAVLAMQEFAVYEPTGISVIATETRMVFETGAFSSPDNPITQAMGAGSATGGVQNSGGAIIASDQSSRAAAAVATSVPMLFVVAILSILGIIGTRRLGAVESVDAGAWPRSLDAGWKPIVLSWLIVMIALGAPLAALVLSLKRRFDPWFVWTEFSDHISGSLLVAGITGAVAFVIALAASARRFRTAVVIALISFLIGGQLIAIGLIRLYNRDGLIWLYESAAVITMAYIARFGWVVLLAAGATWSTPWRALRDLAALDGASPLRIARHVIWPLAWPTLAAAALFVTTLSLSEVPATVLISPQRPQLVVPLLMTWVHMLRYDAMIEVSLLMAGIVFGLGLVAVLLGWLGSERNAQASRINDQSMTKSSSTNKNKKARWLGIGIWGLSGPWGLIGHWSLVTGASLAALFLTGCDRNDSPDEIWMETGKAPGQVVYPRGIAYSKEDDTFFVVDRAGHLQHFDRRGRFLNDWFMPLSAQGKPVGISVGPDGNVYVPDTHYHRVMVYSPKGDLLRQWGQKGTEPGEFIYPTDIAFDAQGHVFVSEYGDNDRIQVFDLTGKFLYAFGKFGTGAGELSRPQSMVIIGDTLYVTDSCNHRIGVFKTDGTFIRNMGRVGSDAGEFRFPYGMDMDEDGNLIVCEFGNNRVQKIDPKTGQSKASWGGSGREPGRLAYPWGVCVDQRNRVIAVDAGNNRLQVFEF